MRREIKFDRPIVEVSREELLQAFYSLLDYQRIARRLFSNPFRPVRYNEQSARVVLKPTR